MERRNDKRNILIVTLALIAVVMSVGFALLSSTLNITATGEITGDWIVKFKSDSLEQTAITDGVKNVTAEIDNDNLKVTLDADFEKPGDKVSYRVAVENLGSIDAYLKNVNVEGTEGNTDAIKLSYEVKDNSKSTTYTKGSIAGMTPIVETPLIENATLNKMADTVIDNNYVDITLEYQANTTAVASGASATYTLELYYEQPEATNNEN